MNDEIAPEIAELLAQTANSLPTSSSSSRDFTPDFSYDMPEPDKSPADIAGVDLSIKKFNQITQFFAETPYGVLNDPAYYKTALSGENESSQKLHGLLSKYLQTKDPKDRSVYRQQIIAMYWEFIKSLAPKMSVSSTPISKRYLMRFAAVLPSLLTEEQKNTFDTVIWENVTGEPVYYIDEWFRDIAKGIISTSATDEAKPLRRSSGNNSSVDDSVRLQQLNTKNTGRLQNAENLLFAKEQERSAQESDLQQKIKYLCEHQPMVEMQRHFQPYNEMQKRLFAEIIEKLKNLQKIDKELINYVSEYREALEISESLKKKMENITEEIEVDKSSLYTELSTVRQMAKMTCGRQGNHFPILTREYFHSAPRQTGFRENVIDIMAWIESIDPGVFCRIHKNQSNRIVPYVVLVPTYGDIGMCWEPFDRYNRTTSRGRIVVPMYSKNLQIAVITAVADLRWQVAKEKASVYWMEEGLTGQYYQWFSSQKLKGDLKDYFINDYVFWITKESEGVQRLDKEIRGVFWRHMPFAQEIKEKLKTRSLIYQELYQRDINRSMSDGY